MFILGEVHVWDVLVSQDPCLLFLGLQLCGWQIHISCLHADSTRQISATSFVSICFYLRLSLSCPLLKYTYILYLDTLSTLFDFPLCTQDCARLCYPAVSLKGLEAAWVLSQESAFQLSPRLSGEFGCHCWAETSMNPLNIGFALSLSKCLCFAPLSFSDGDRQTIGVWRWWHLARETVGALEKTIEGLQRRDKVYFEGGQAVFHMWLFLKQYISN